VRDHTFQRQTWLFVDNLHGPFIASGVSFTPPLTHTSEFVPRYIPSIMASASFSPLTSIDDFQTALQRAQDQPIVLYKHSAICPISARMQKEVATLTEPGDPPLYRVVVQDARDVSDAIEEQLGVRHESPQALLVYQSTVLLDASHGRISADDLRTAATQTAHD